MCPFLIDPSWLNNKLAIFISNVASSSFWLYETLGLFMYNIFILEVVYFQFFLTSRPTSLPLTSFLDALLSFCPKHTLQSCLRCPVSKPSSKTFGVWFLECHPPFLEPRFPLQSFTPNFNHFPRVFSVFSVTNFS